MKTEYEYIRFRRMRMPTRRKTAIYQCLSGGIALGVVKWYSPWRQFCFFPEGHTTFNVGCLSDVQHFIGQLMEARR